MSIIKKCIDELNSQTPRLEYVLGMLETYYELSGERAKDEKPNVYTPSPIVPGAVVANPNAPITTAVNAEILDRIAAAKIKDVEAMVAKSTQ